MRRLTTLDGMRGVAAMAVAVFHICAIMHRNVFPEAGLAVDFFFLLSGYVIGLAYEGKLSRSMSLLEFIARRMARLGPMLWVGLALGASYFLVGYHGLERHRVPGLFALGALGLPAFSLVLGWTYHPLDPPEWSLTNELAVNFLWASVSSRIRGWLLGSIVLGCAVMLGALAWHAGSVTNGYHQGLGILVRGFLRAVLSFSMGLALFQVRERLPRIAVPSPILAMVLLSMLLISAGRFAWAYELGCILVLNPLLLVAGISRSPGGREGRILEVAGDMSYPLYTLHFPIALWIFALTPSSGFPVKFAVAIATVLSLLAAWLCQRYIDRPMQRLLGALIDRTFARLPLRPRLVPVQA